MKYNFAFLCKKENVTIVCITKITLKALDQERQIQTFQKEHFLII